MISRGLIAVKKTFVVGLISLSAFAASPSVFANTLFYCQTQSGKQVEVQDFGSIIHYRFGKKLVEAELQLTVSRDLASTYQWIGAGSNEYYSVSIPNPSAQNAIVYRVFTSRERKPDGKTESGIDVLSQGKIMATILCQNESVYEQLIGVDLPAE